MDTDNLIADSAHREFFEHLPGIITKYRLVDLGDAQGDSSKLSCLPTKISLSPRINNQGVVTVNRHGGGVVLVPSRWEYAPKINGVMIDIYGIDRQGDLLVTLNRGNESQEWMLWPTNENRYATGRKHIHTMDPFVSDFIITDFNDAGRMIGYRKEGDKARPFVWTESEGFSLLGGDHGLKLFGITKNINERGCVAGIVEDVGDRTPFLWDEGAGLVVMHNYRQTLTPKGWVEFADMVLTEDNTIYGTFWMKYVGKESTPDTSYPYFAYTWDPTRGSLRMLDLQGMRLAAVNSHHILVGSKDEKAMIRNPGNFPLELAALMDPDSMVGWHLIEATSINDQDQIVGYGWKYGKMHLFLADPIK